MTKPKLPYASDRYKYDQAYAEGLKATSHIRLARAINQMLKKYPLADPGGIKNWLTARAKRRKP